MLTSITGASLTMTAIHILTLLTQSASAPLNNNSSAIFLWPHWAALCNGVSPDYNNIYNTKCGIIKTVYLNIGLKQILSTHQRFGTWIVKLQLEYSLRSRDLTICRQGVAKNQL